MNVTLRKLWDDMLSRIRRKNSINSQFAFCTQSADCILYLVYILYRPDWYWCFFSSEPQSLDRNNGARKKILVRLSWPLWLICGLYVEEFPRTSPMIEQWLLYINWRRTQMRGLPIGLPLIHSVYWNEPTTGPLRCKYFGFSIQVASFEARKFDSSLSFLLNHTNILFLSTWVSELHRN